MESKTESNEFIAILNGYADLSPQVLEKRFLSKIKDLATDHSKRSSRSRKKSRACKVLGELFRSQPWSKCLIGTIVGYTTLASDPESKAREIASWQIPSDRVRTLEEVASKVFSRREVDDFFQTSCPNFGQIDLGPTSLPTRNAVPSAHSTSTRELPLPVPKIQHPYQTPEPSDLRGTQPHGRQPGQPPVHPDNNGGGWRHIPVPFQSVANILLGLDSRLHLELRAIPCYENFHLRGFRLSSRSGDLGLLLLHGGVQNMVQASLVEDSERMLQMLTQLSGQV